MKTCSSCNVTAENVIRYRFNTDETVNLCDKCSIKYNYTFN
jgi:hypothetical protein